MIKIFKGHQEVHQNFSSVVLTIGNFDGLHLGHRQIIESVITKAKSIAGTSVVYTFRPHPQEILGPNNQIDLINTYDEKLMLLSQMGVDIVIEQPFNREFSSTSAENFLRDIIVKKLCPKAIHVGYDFGFGKDRAGSLEVLTKLCKEEDVDLVICKPVKIGDSICSSTRVRECLRSGDVKGANGLLGREFFYRGLVIRGNGRGKKIGFATANVHSDAKLMVKEGVYATRAVHNGKVFESVTNIGRQPTFNLDNPVPVVMETHFLGFDKDIYGETIEVRLVERIRDEKKFSGVDELIVQIGKDIELAKKILKT